MKCLKQDHVNYSLQILHMLIICIFEIHLSIKVLTKTIAHFVVEFAYTFPFYIFTDSKFQRMARIRFYDLGSSSLKQQSEKKNQERIGESSVIFAIVKKSVP